MTTVRAEIYDFGHDVYGNPTANFTLWKDGEVIYKTKRRRQTGYASDHADGALWNARRVTKDTLHLVSYIGHRSEGQVTATFNSTKLEDRVYTFKNRVSGDFIAVKHGDEPGYHNTTVYTQDHCDVLNDRQAITLAEIKAAEACSMSGKWVNFKYLVREFS